MDTISDDIGDDGPDLPIDQEEVESESSESIFAFDNLQAYLKYIVTSKAPEKLTSIARSVGLTRGAFHNILIGKRAPRPKSINAIATYLGLTGNSLRYFTLLCAHDRKDSCDTHLAILGQIVFLRLEYFTLMEDVENVQKCTAKLAALAVLSE